MSTKWKFLSTRVQIVVYDEAVEAGRGLRDVQSSLIRESLVMSTKWKFLPTLLVFSLLFVSSASAGVLGGIAGAYNDGTGPGVGGAWTGSTTYTNGLAPYNDLIGTIDYAVMTAGDYATAFPGSSYVAGDSMVYLYQVNNEGNFALSAEIVGITNPANSIGQFENVSGDVASSLFGFDIIGNAIWNFTAPLVGGGESTYVLTFSSPNTPMLGTSLSVNGGTFGVSLVPTPSANPIPEPTGLILAATGALFASIRRRKGNR